MPRLSRTMIVASLLLSSPALAETLAVAVNGAAVTSQSGVKLSLRQIGHRREMSGADSPIYQLRWSTGQKKGALRHTGQRMFAELRVGDRLLQLLGLRGSRLRVVLRDTISRRWPVGEERALKLAERFAKKRGVATDESGVELTQGVYRCTFDGLVVIVGAFSARDLSSYQKRQRRRSPRRPAVSEDPMDGLRR